MSKDQKLKGPNVFKEGEEGANCGVINGALMFEEQQSRTKAINKRVTNRVPTS